MPDIGRVFKEETSRLARKEVRSAVNPLQGQVKQLRRGMAELKGQIAKMERMISRLSKEASKQQTADAEPEEGATFRVSPASIKKHRQRLRLSQAQMGKLLDVSAITILNWEQGKSRPRDANKAAIAELRGMGLRDVGLLLEGLS